MTRRAGLHSIARLAAIAICASLVGCSYSGTVTNAFATKAEAEQAGAVAAGWIPRGLPPSAYELREAHHASTNQRWGLFSFEPSEGESLRAILQPDQVSLAGRAPDLPARIEWWPLLLRREPDAEQLKTAGLEAYRAKDEPLVVVVNWKQGRAYYWSF